VIDFDDVWENGFALKHGQTVVAWIESD
jgi:hypothetical protein